MSLQQTQKAFYQQYADMVFNLCLNYTQNQQVAEELTQDIFVKALLNLPNFKGNSSAKTWLYKIAINTCNDFSKAQNAQKRSWLKALFSTNAGTYEVQDFNHPGVQLEQKQAVQHIFKCINRLPENQKTALILKSIDGLAQQEIAEIMNLKIKAVESLLSRARTNLQKILNESEGF